MRVDLECLIAVKSSVNYFEREFLAFSTVSSMLYLCNVFIFMQTWIHFLFV